MTPQEAFVTRLRPHRQRNRISLEEIAEETRVKQELFAAFEANDLSAWPRGLYARAWVRTYACAVGLDPIDTVDGSAGCSCRAIAADTRRCTTSRPSWRRRPSSRTNSCIERRRPAPGAPIVPAPPESWPGAVAGAARQGARAAGDLFSGFTRQVKAAAASTNVEAGSVHPSRPDSQICRTSL